MCQIWEPAFILYVHELARQADNDTRCSCVPDTRASLYNSPLSSYFTYLCLFTTNHVHILLELIFRKSVCIYFWESNRLFVVSAGFTSALIVGIFWFRHITFTLKKKKLLYISHRVKIVDFVPLSLSLEECFKGIWNRRNDAPDYNYRLKKSNLLQVKRNYMEMQEDLLINTKI